MPDISIRTLRPGNVWPYPRTFERRGGTYPNLAHRKDHHFALLQAAGYFVKIDQPGLDTKILGRVWVSGLHGIV